MSTPEQIALWAERTGASTYLARSSSGAQITVAPEGTEGAFSPADLLRLALATCNLMSADKVLARRLGEEFTASVAAETTKVDGENRYGEATVEMVLDLSGLSAQEREKLTEVVGKAVDRGCTVGRTMHAGLPHSLTIASEAS